jgi:hypothetical protein
MTATRLTLDTIKRRLHMTPRYAGAEVIEDTKQPLFKVDVVLAIPNVQMKVCMNVFLFADALLIQIEALSHIHRFCNRNIKIRMHVMNGVFHIYTVNVNKT